MHSNLEGDVYGERRTREAGRDAGARAAGQPGEARSPAGAAGSPARPAESAEAAEASRGRLTAPWWERTPGRLEYELEALRQAGIQFEQDEEARARGIIRLNLLAAVEGERFPLVVTFPDLYPYFRFEVDAPTLDLDHHQNPFGKNLCLLGRETFYWDTTDTVAGLLGEQLPTVLKTGRSADKEASLGLEHHQAEPIGVFYPYPPSMVVLPFDCTIPERFTHGTFTVAAEGPQGPPPKYFLRGTMAELRSADGATIVGAPPGLIAANPGERLLGSWVRASEPIRHVQHDQFIKELLRRHPLARKAHANRVSSGWLQIWGVVYPEEVGWRQGGEGWIFVCLFDEKRHRLVSPHPQTPPPKPGHGSGRKSKRGRKR